MIRPLLASLVAVSILASSTASRADETAPPPEPRAASTTSWYGYQTLATDGVALALALSTIPTKNGATTQGFGVGALTMYGVGAPIVHFSHGHVGKGFLDLGLRIGIPIAFGFIGAELATATVKCSPDLFSIGGPSPAMGGCPAGSEPGAGFAPLALAAFGALVGAGTASILDAAVLAREPAAIASMNDDSAAPPPPAPQPSSWTSKLQPAFNVLPERGGGARASVGVTGTF
jgi:hypothetical protein